MMTGQELVHLRKKYGVTQLQVAEYLGYVSKGKPNRSMIARFECGHAPINMRISKAIESFFKELSSENIND